MEFVEDVVVSPGYYADSTRMTPDEMRALLRGNSVEQQTYTVQSGDVLGAIAAKYDMSLSELLELNPGVDPNSFTLEIRLLSLHRYRF